MSLLCLLNFCQREATTCRCRRCGREMHAWRENERRTMEAELLGLTSAGLMRYEETIFVQEHCDSCGAVREKTKHAQIDH